MLTERRRSRRGGKGSPSPSKDYMSRVVSPLINVYLLTIPVHFSVCPGSADDNDSVCSDDRGYLNTATMGNLEGPGGPLDKELK